MQAKQAATAVVVSLALPIVLAAPAEAAPYLHLSNSGPSELALSSVPHTYLSWYQQAARTCRGLPWPVLAGIGEMESDHGQSTAPGVHSAANFAGAEGPMQFEPGTFTAFAVKADHVRRLSPYDPQDAIFTAAHMLCADGARGGSPSGIASALFAYNHADWYPPQVMRWAAKYATSGAAHPVVVLKRSAATRAMRRRPVVVHTVTPRHARVRIAPHASTAPHAIKMPHLTVAPHAIKAPHAIRALPVVRAPHAIEVPHVTHVRRETEVPHVTITRHAPTESHVTATHAAAPHVTKPHVAAPHVTTPHVAASKPTHATNPLAPITTPASPVPAPTATVQPSGVTPTPSVSQPTPAPSATQPASTSPATTEQPTTAPQPTAPPVSGNAQQLAAESEQLSAEAQQLSDEAQQLSAEAQQLSQPEPPQVTPSPVTSESGQTPEAANSADAPASPTASASSPTASASSSTAGTTSAAGRPGAAGPVPTPDPGQDSSTP